MKKILIIGGGLSGLTSAVYLSKLNHKVTLLEASPKFGGRTYSIFNETKKEFFDNGQHLLMGCYEETLDFLKLMDAEHLIEIQPYLDLTYVDKDSIHHKLRADKLNYPFNLLRAILKFSGLSFKERLLIIDFLLDMLCCNKEDLSDLTVYDWLKLKGQGQNAINSFWELLTVSTLNTKIEEASAVIFDEVLTRIFFTGNDAAKIIFPKTNLNQLFVEPALTFLKNHKNNAIHSEKVTQINFENEFVKSIVSESRVYSNYDFYIFAIPIHSLQKIKNIESQLFHSHQIEYSPIVNAHIWLNRNPFTERIYGLMGSELHWIFNNGNFISLTSSASNRWGKMDKEIIIQEICSEIKKYFPIFNKEMVEDWKIIKEKRATFRADSKILELRKAFMSQKNNLLFTGDWVDNGLPATIEGAIMNGKKAAKAVADA
ncbi:MAG: hydroxysqualene dehydroxylase HpnE [Melioribacteraceae bacterium]|jgi:squalene-associated FAD-dependent desaturase|nr:hydroxysqualene dehydroxylase HpnE [Melioribacteraceae bacterium]